MKNGTRCLWRFSTVGVGNKTLHYFPFYLGAAGCTSDCALIIFDTFTVASLSDFSEAREKMSILFL